MNVAERKALQSAIWKIADELRGSVDGWDFKQYVLGVLFYRFISESLENYINEAEGAGFAYAELSDDKAKDAKDEIVRQKGFFILPSELFSNIIKNLDKHEENINEILKSVFKNIENSAKNKASAEDIKGLFDDIDLNSNRLGANTIARNKNISKVLKAINDIDFASYGDTINDIAGDAYEYLMSMYASNAGKSGGEFFTPASVSELLAHLVLNGAKDYKSATIYDPACGSGSLLIKAHKQAQSKGIKAQMHGQELNITTYNLCRINMFLHNVGYENFSITNGDTLTEPKFTRADDSAIKLDIKEFSADFVVSNPPYSTSWEGDNSEVLVADPRYSPAGKLAPKSYSDLAFIMHSLYLLKDTGAIVCFPGIMYRGGAEKTIREYMLKNNFIDCVIALPENLFFGTSIATCIMVLKKRKKDESVLFINATSFYEKEPNNNYLSDENIARILDIYNKRENSKFCALVSNDEIIANSSNLSPSAYFESEQKEQIDINEVNSELNVCLKEQNELRAKIDEILKEL